MTAKRSKAGLPAEIRSVLSALRRRIVAYVWLEGLCVALIWVGLIFWASLAIDYLPVMVGANELPREARAILLAITGIVLGWILYRWILQRTLVRMPNRSMAVLLERRFEELRDSLITTVELSESSDHDASASQEEMLSDTESEALSGLRKVRLGRVFNLRPLTFSIAGALFLVLTVGVFYATKTQAFELGVRRLLFLEDTPWPRNSQIEVVGVSVAQIGLDGETSTDLVRFDDRRVKVARGSSISLMVRADGKKPVVPKVCTIYYDTAEGDRGRVNMTKVGRLRDGYQAYTYDGKPLKGILSEVTFDVVGSDHRVRDYTIEVVDAPSIVGLEADCVFPEYMVNEQLSLWLPRTVALSTGTQFPIGTELKIRARTNKPLTCVRVKDVDKDSVTVIEGETLERTPGEFQYRVDGLQDNLSLEITLVDQDRVTSERPHRLYISGIEDQPPVLDVSLSGIGTSVTPDVLVPVRGKITDDYGVADSWFEIFVNDESAIELDLAVGAGGVAEASIDFRDQRSSEEVSIEPGDKLNLTVKAEDRFNLSSEPHVGVSDRYQLEVVSPDELLSRLEARELGLRRRFEQIIEEVTLLRDSLLRVKNDGPNSESPADEPGDEETEKEEVDPQVAARERIERIWTLRLLRAQRGLLQSQKSAQETLGVAASFEDIREELINNRVDTPDRKQRLQEQIVDPLNHVGETLFPELDTRLEAIAAAMDGRISEFVQTGDEDQEVVLRADASIAQANAILLEMDGVLKNMLDLETFNELLDIVRSMIDDQKRLINDTKKEQKKQVLDLLN